VKHYKLYRVPIFAGLVFSSFQAPNATKSVIERNGGIVEDVIREETTHLLINNKTSLAFSTFAGKIVDTTWVKQCVKSKTLKPE
jgi:hypothetical protein